MIRLRDRVISRSSRMRKPNGSMRASSEEKGSGSNPTNTRPPSSGGSGSRLKTANTILIKIPRSSIKTIGTKKSTSDADIPIGELLPIMGTRNLSNKTHASARRKLVIGPASATQIMSRLGFRRF